MPAHSGNGQSSDERPPDRNGGINDLITEVETLRNMLGDATNRAHRLLGALKHHRRQAKAVQAAVGALKHMQLGD